MRTAVKVGIVAAVASATFASADLITLSFPITVEQSVPAPDVTGFSPSGNGVVTLDTDSNLFSWTISYQGLTGPIVAPGAHFHGPADFGQTAGVELFISTGNPEEPPTSVLTGSATISNQQATDVLAGLWYVNIHTARNGAGEIRGQVVPAPAAIATLAGAGLLTTRRRR